MPCRRRVSAQIRVKPLFLCFVFCPSSAVAVPYCCRVPFWLCESCVFFFLSEANVVVEQKKKHGFSINGNARTHITCTHDASCLFLSCLALRVDGESKYPGQLLFFFVLSFICALVRLPSSGCVDLLQVAWTFCFFFSCRS